MSEAFLISADDEMLAAIGRAWWNGLYLGALMADVARRLGVEPHGVTLGGLRARMTRQVRESSVLDDEHRVRLLHWLDGLADVVDGRNDLGHAEPFILEPGHADGINQGLRHVRTGTRRNPGMEGTVVTYETPADVYERAHEIERAAVDGNVIYFDVWVQDPDDADVG